MIGKVSFITSLMGRDFNSSMSHRSNIIWDNSWATELWSTKSSSSMWTWCTHPSLALAQEIVVWCPVDLLSTLAPLGAKDASALLGVEESLSPLINKGAEGILPIPDRASAFLGTSTSITRIGTIRDTTQVVVVGATMISISSSLWVDTLGIPKVTRGCFALATVEGAPTNGPPT